MSSVGVANGSLQSSSSSSHSAMGATDVLPYPRRRSSVQLEPLECRLMSSDRESQNSPVVKSRISSTGAENNLPGAVVEVSSCPPVLNPVRLQGHRRLVNTLSDDIRCNSCENPHRGRSQSLRPDRMVRPGEASRRRLVSDEADEDQTTAEFIEKLRKELISQMTHV